MPGHSGIAAAADLARFRRKLMRNHESKSAFRSNLRSHHRYREGTKDDWSHWIGEGKGGKRPPFRSRKSLWWFGLLGLGALGALLALLRHQLL